MKKYFLTGLVMLLPVALTAMIVIFLFNFLTEPLAGALAGAFGYNLVGHNSLKILSQLLVLIVIFLFTVGLGVIGRWVFVHYLVRFGEDTLQRIPFVSGVYKTTQDVIRTLFTTEANAFKQVVLAPFPNKNTSSIGLVTRGEVVHPGNGEKLVAVFVPTAPNPTSGYLMMFKKEDLVYLDMKVEDAMKYIISCGVVPVTFTKVA